MPSIPRWSREKKTIFLETLRRTGNVSSSARAAGVPVVSAYAKRGREKAFRLEWQTALDEALDDLEEEVRRRALEGIEKPVYYAGKKCGSITSFNDNLAMFLLKAKRPGVFSENPQGEVPQGEMSSKPRERIVKKLAEMKLRLSKTNPE